MSVICVTFNLKAPYKYLTLPHLGMREILEHLRAWYSYIVSINLSIGEALTGIILVSLWASVFIFGKSPRAHLDEWPNEIFCMIKKLTHKFKI